MGGSMKKVSVIVPFYNSEKYLDKCISSLVNQTLSDIEIILVNDGSTDSSFQIAQEFRNKYPDKIILLTKPNGGQGSARNLGIKTATASYIGFLDSDDYASIDTFKLLYETASSASADMVECNYYYINAQNEKVLKSYGNLRQFVNQKDMFINPLVDPWNKLYRSEILQNNNIIYPEGLIYEDTSFFIKTIPYLYKTVYINQKLIYHYMWPQSTMNSNRGQKVANIFPVLQDILDFYDQMGFYTLYQNELEFFITKILLCSSLQRISLIKDYKLRRTLLLQTMHFLQDHFPRYKKNPYFQHGKIGFYVHIINSKSIGFFTFLLKFL